MSAESSQLNTPSEDAEGAQKDADDYESMQVQSTDLLRPLVLPRWPTRVFAIECLLKVIATCENDKNHFDLAAARREKSQTKGLNVLLEVQKKFCLLNFLNSVTFFDSGLTQY